MGLAASQARYLSLTARKTNVEYEGQQVNQERTALANQSAALYNEMLTLDVPTPPSATDFTRTVYTYTDPSEYSTSITIDQIVKNPIEEGKEATYDLYIKRKQNINVSNIVEFTSSTFGTSNTKPVVYPYGTATPYTLNGPETADGYLDSINEANSKVVPARDAFNEGQKFYYYKDLSTATYFYIPIQDSWKNEDGSAWSPEEFVKRYTNGEVNDADITYYSVQSMADEEDDVIRDAKLQIANDGTGRYNYITYTKGDQQMTLKLTQQTIQDDDAYDAAMETYEAKKAIYDKTVSEINAKTVIIQQQDRTLELHLDQLDTEQQAIQTELDAVKKVIDKNIEETFKIFA